MPCESLQHMAVIAPADPGQVPEAILALREWTGPAYLRLGKNDNVSVRGLNGRFELGRVQEVRQGSDLVIFAMGGITVSVVTPPSSSRSKVSRPVSRSSPVSTRLQLRTSLVYLESSSGRDRRGPCLRRAASVHWWREIIADNGAGCRLLRLGVERPFSGRSGSEQFLHQAHGLSPNAVAARIAAWSGAVSVV